MISYNRFILLLKKHLLDPLFLIQQGYDPLYSTQIVDFKKNYDGTEFGEGQLITQDFNGHVIWSHEEPLNETQLNHLLNINLYSKTHSSECKEWRDIINIPSCNKFYDVSFHVFANSEKSLLKNKWFKKFSNAAQIYDWYFFFHGFAALDWYRDFKLLPDPYKIKPTKVFISLNHLIQKKRNYRITLLSLLTEKRLLNHGLVSYPLLSPKLIKSELLDRHSLLSSDAKKHIAKYLKNAGPYILDKTDYNSASADICREMHMGIWNLVTETVFYDDKLHLTEKIFKPIVIKRPFILIGAPGNLEYLKSYGFKTFGQWIDESYDSELNQDIRIQKIINEVEKLCNLSWEQNLKIFNEMQEILDYNHNHFFTNFKNIIVNELVDNFEICTKRYNLHLSDRFRLPIEKIDFKKVKEELLIN
jgi:hypothetical protein